MGFRFRKSISIIPGVRINIGRRGISTTIGGRGTSINIGPKGTYVNASLRGTGLSYRHRVASGSIRRTDISTDRKYDSGPLPTGAFLIPGTEVDYGSADPSMLTSTGLESFKELVISTQNRKKEIEVEIQKAKSQLFWTRVKRTAFFILLFGFVLAKLNRSTRARINELISDISILNQNLINTKISIDFNMETEIAEPFQRMERYFEAMSLSQAKWSIASTQMIDRIKARSWAGTIINRFPVAFSRGSYALVQTSTVPLLLGTLKKKASVYFYPGFVIVTGPNDFAIIDITEIKTQFLFNNFQESELVPKDAEIVGYAWAKSNKDGSRDRRFSANRQIPIVKYGSFYLLSDKGLNEAYMISCPIPCRDFVLALEELKASLRSHTSRQLS